MIFSDVVSKFSVLPALGEALLHFIWQGALVALLLAFALRSLRRQSANARYLAACGALLLMVALPAWTLWRSLADPPAAAAPAQGMPAAAAPRAPGLYGLALPLPAVPSEALWTSRELRERAAPWLALAWLAGVLILSLRFCGGWLLVRRLQRIGTRAVPPHWRETAARLAREAGIRRPVRVLESSLAQVPMVIGWLRPAILLPAAALTGLTPQQLEAILAHELAHVRRNDYWMNLLQAAAEILLFYHPAVWWVSNRIRVEREHSCDDMGVAVCGDALTYARALVVVEELRSAAGPPRLSLALDGSPLLQRVRRLFEAPSPGQSASARWAVGLLVTATALTLALGLEVSWAAPPPPAPPAPPAAPAAPAPARPAPPTAPTPPAPAAPTPPAPAAPTAPTSPAPAAPWDPIRGMTEEEIATLVGRGLDRGLLEELRSSGDRVVALDEARRWQGRGVNPRLLDALGALGHASLTVDQLLNLIWFGVDDRFIQGVRELGYDKLSVDDLIQLGRYGANAAFVEGFRKIGYRDLSVEQLTMFGRYQVDGAYADSLHRSGYRNLSVDDLILLRRYEVDSRYAEEIGAAGYRNLPVEDLVSLRRYGVTGEMLRRFVPPDGPRPTVEEVLEAARYGRLK
jgi:beta-lactamase regulating signal transducer with metallopeptidase domain